MSRSARVPSPGGGEWGRGGGARAPPEPRSASIRWGSTRRDETSAVATRSSYCSGDANSAGLSGVLRLRILMVSGPPRRGHARPRLDVLGVEAARHRIGLGDDAVLDEDRERLLQGDHAVAHSGDKG